MRSNCDIFPVRIEVFNITSIAVRTHHASHARKIMLFVVLVVALMYTTLAAEKIENHYLVCLCLKYLAMQVF